MVQTFLIDKVGNITELDEEKHTQYQQQNTEQYTYWLELPAFNLQHAYEKKEKTKSTKQRAKRCHTLYLKRSRAGNNKEKKMGGGWNNSMCGSGS